MNKNEKPTLENYNKSDLICNSNYSFWKYYRDREKFDKLSLKSKKLFLANLFDSLDKFNKKNTKNTKKTKQKAKMQMYIMQLQNYIIIC